MTTDLMPFTYEGAEIRTVLNDGEPVFIGKDACDVLGITKYRDAIVQLDDDERVSVAVDTLGGRQQMVAVTESGLYALMLISRSPKVKPFRKWITGTVLPQIRKTGSYRQPKHFDITSLDDLAQLTAAASIAIEMAQELRAKVAELAPKGEAFDDLMDSNGLFSMEAAAKSLGWGRNILFRDLRRLGILQGNNLPYQRYAHHFKVVPGTYTNRKSGELVPTATTFVRPAGLEFLRRKLAGVAVLVEVDADA